MTRAKESLSQMTRRRKLLAQGTTYVINLNDKQEKKITIDADKAQCEPWINLLWQWHLSKDTL